MTLAQQYRLLLFGSLYFAQGGALSYFLSYNIVFLRGLGYDAEDIGTFQAVLILPFVLKIVLGAVSDRFSLFGLGHRHPYILLGLLIQAGAFLLMPSIADTRDWQLFFIAALVGAVGMALYDTCTDGLAVEITPEEDRSQVQGMMVGARAAGMLYAMLLGPFLVDLWGWSALFVMVAVFCLPGTVMIVGLRKLTATPQLTTFSWGAFSAFDNSQVWLLALIGVLFALALDGVLTFLSMNLASGKGFDLHRLSWVLIAAMLGRLVGATLLGVFADKLGYRKSLVVVALVAASGCLGLAMVEAEAWVYAVAVVIGVAYGFFMALYASMAMALSNPRIAASMFAIFMIFLNIGAGLGQIVAGQMTFSFGFQMMSISMAALLALNVVLSRYVRTGHSS